jgi:hypothetical protein
MGYRDPSEDESSGYYVQGDKSSQKYVHSRPVAVNPKVPPPPNIFPKRIKQIIDTTIAPSVNMLALKINSEYTNEHRAILEWVNARLKLLIHI